MIDIWQTILDRVQGKAPKGAKRARGWRKVRKAHITAHPVCEVCGLKSKPQVHHIIPFHVAPDLELNPDNLMTLCETKKYGINCHLLIGHLGNYRRINTAIHTDYAIWHKKIKG